MAAPALRTIRQSFDDALPNYPNPNLGVAAHASISGDSTLNTDPPHFSIAAQQNWFNLGRIVLGHANIAGPNHAVNRECIYFNEVGTYHNSEGDVVRSAAEYLLHPVNQVIGGLGAPIRCQSEATTNRIRSDITYYRGPLAPVAPTPGNPGHGGNPEYKAIAVVEFKKRGVIKPNEFTTANRFANPATPPTQQQLDDAAMAAQNRPNRSYFAGDALILIKQAASYAIAHRTPYVALFDWDFLVLVHFTQLNLNNKYAGDFCEVQVIPYAQSQTMRAALLGFMAHAHTHAPVV
ncbi:hypothetical protein F5144DRAFT_599977 [Chaetomium tenue]|uniref:Uncharacterized protein n=1 Tax=Chaetomium tenue TaxID=1854479 RepID=A0ACB7PJW3_9PEZI|nr:hypothetical protein F5144DRAFT_599977 [Chaetomium globosum]